MTRYGIGVEIGGTKLQVGTGHGGSELTRRCRKKVDPSGGAQRILQDLTGMVPELLQETGISRSDVAGVGIGFGGPVDSKRGYTLVSHQIDGWDSFPLQQWAQEQWEFPTRIQNDASLAGYAEAIAGAGKGCERVFYITIGSGIGGGWIHKGIIDEGQGLGAAEIGHNWVPHPVTGKPEKLEWICSGWSIAKRAVEYLESGKPSVITNLVNGNLEEISAEIVYKAAEMDDPLALTILGETCETLGLAIANVFALLHPEKVIIGGGVSLMGDLFWDRLKDAVGRRIFGPFRDSWCIARAALGEDVVVVGGVLLALSG
ncbi:MAG TPA: ROK family protein [bacterium]|nr:ROK family protein [bacterium]HQL62589.1 ROK family protein [bacterium]